MEFLEAVPLAVWAMAAIGGVVFAAVFNIPARSKLLSIESNTRQRAMRYDALNFVTFYITWIVPIGILWGLNNGDWGPLVVASALFLTYSVAFWVVLKTYMSWKDRD